MSTVPQPAAGARRASVTDVARRAGVSVGTVSNVLNRPERVSEPTRRRVEQAIDELRFVPNGVARQLRVGSVKTVGAVVLDLTNTFFMEMARGLQDRLETDDWTMMLAASDGFASREDRFLRLFEEHGVSGVAVVRSSDRIDELQNLASRGVGVVLLDSPSSVPGLSWVAVDDAAGGRMVAEHLLGLGHRRIAMLTGPESMHQYRERRRGAAEALSSAGLDPAEALVEIPVPMNADGGGLGIHTLLALPPADRPRAVFCVNDLVGLGAIRALHREGLKIPDDMAVAGFDDADFAAELTTPMTTVRRPGQTIGATAASLLLRPAGSPPEQILFPPRLIIRSSTTG